MHWSPKQPLFLVFVCSAGVQSLVVPTYSHPTVDGWPVETQGNGHSVSVKFEASCDRCFEPDVGLIFELNLSSTKAACGESDILLNNKTVDLTWDGIKGVGASIIVAELADGSGSCELSTSWHSHCIASHPRSLDEYAAQILAVNFHPTAQAVDEGRSGFAISFNPVGMPKILRLVTSPITIPGKGPPFDAWLPGSGFFQTQTIPLEVASNGLDLELELQKLQVLKADARKLGRIIQSKDQEIRMQLLQDCTSLLAGVKACRTLKCFINTSFRILPEIFHRMKYKFGPLPPSLSELPCRPSLNSASGSDNGTLELIPDSNSNPEIPSVEDDIDSLSSVKTSAIFPPQLTPNQPSPAMLVARQLTIILLVLAIAGMVLRRCRNSPSCRRRRVDLASRREERRNRAAYRNAARRYRWRQWWNGQFHQHTHVLHESQQSLTHAARDEEDQASGADSSPSQGGDDMHAEIISLRRVLEYVGELVRPDDSQDTSRSGRRQLRLGGGELAAAPYLISTTAPSSTAPLTTIGSPRTSTVLSYDTDSVTLDSLDSDVATILTT